MSTRALLLGMGFQTVEAAWTEQQPGYQYDFGNFMLEASELMSLHFQRVMQFSGVQSDQRSIKEVDFQLPLNVECYEQGVALIANGIGRNFKPLIPTDWLEQGRQLQDYLPGMREIRLYDKRPQCLVEADWFKVAAKRLMAVGTTAKENATTDISFREHFLRFDTGQDVIVMPAHGDEWQQEYRCQTSAFQHISKRTPKAGVWFSVWGGNFMIGPLGLKAEPVEVKRVDTLPDRNRSRAIDQAEPLIAWCPSGIDQGLGAVLIRRGQVTQSQWWDALSERVTSCQVPCDYVPRRSWPLFKARQLMHGVISSFKHKESTA